MDANVQAGTAVLKDGFQQHNFSESLLANDQALSSGSFTQQSSSSATYATDAQGLYKDPNPQVVRRAALGGPQTYTQRISVRFLKPPPVPPPGVTIPKKIIRHNKPRERERERDRKIERHILIVFHLF